MIMKTGKQNITLAAFILISLLTSCRQETKASRPPNIVVIMADDLGFAGALNVPQIPE
jgi:hypothetical protein